MNGPPLGPLLEAAEYHLSQRNFDSCRSYALRSLQAAPYHVGATQILVVSDTIASWTTRISEPLPDWYTILQMYRYSQDSNLIRDQAKKLSLLLHENKFPFADEASNLVDGVWSVLSNPIQKSQFDNELQMFEFKLNDTFWTVCMGFFPLGFDGGERKGVSLWSPFSPMVDVNENVKKKNDGAGVSNEY